LKKVDQFTSDGDLNRRLHELESNAANALDELDRASEHRAKKRYARAAGILARPGDLLFADTGTSLEFLLAPPQNGDEGKSVLVVKAKGAGTITLRAVGTTINGGSVSGPINGVGTYRAVVAEGAYWL
jgi:hypothetical protein